VRLISGETVRDGAGVNLNRVIGTETVDNLDPFLLLDEFRSNNKEDYMAGFPMHPHRGFETITYMVEGSFTHTDSKGNKGSLKSGEVQWMTAGKGIIHEEMPAMLDGELWGYQLWINLPAKLKMTEPKYRHLTATEMPIVKEQGIAVKVISGEYKGTNTPIELNFPVDYYDVRINGGIFEQKLKGTNLIYVHTGKVNIVANKELEVESGNMCVINDYDYANVQVSGENAGFLFISADPLNEPIARYGPFVMNTMDEILQAIDDNNNGVLD
jgi:redox-sensitive bicupin YhaK (pirin superfamily)